MTATICACAPGKPPNLACAIPFHRAQPDAVAYVPVDLAIDGPWRGSDEPPPIAPGTNPGALVAVLYDRGDVEVRRWPLDSAGVDDASDEGARLALGDPDRTIVIYDGDAGAPILRLCTAERRP